MTEPDLFWGPLLGIYSGMRIGEATQIRTQDVHLADNGVHYIHVYKSKTVGGIRNVPIAQALIDMGFLQYVEECKAAGAERIFPHTPYINHSYYKHLSAALLEHQRALKIKLPQTSFHSFRVNVITELHNKDANAGKILKIVGHEDGSGGGQAVHWGYVRDLPDCKEIVDLLQWPIDQTALKYDGRFKDFVSEPKNWAPKAGEKSEPAKKASSKKKANPKIVSKELSMQFKEILARITGISVPIFGIQWQPVQLEVKTARDLLRELEDRRVLYRPEEMEGAPYCVNSVGEMRRILTASMQQLDTNSHLYKQVQRMRRACRDFCDIIGSPKFDAAPYPVQRSLLSRELGKLRQVAGLAIGTISIAYGLDVEDELAAVIPFNNLP